MPKRIRFPVVLTMVLMTETSFNRNKMSIRPFTNSNPPAPLFFPLFCALMSAKPLLLSCLTWNIGNPSEFSISKTVTDILSQHPDICALTFQEFGGPLNPPKGQLPPQFELLKSALSTSLPQEYTLSYAHCEGGVALFLCFLRDSSFKLTIRDDVTVLHSIGRVTRGKASVAARVSAARNGVERTFFIIGNHLECYDEEYPTRNEEWLRTLELVRDRSDYIVMAGDLNYRIELERDKVLDLITRGDYQTLLKHDQLNRAKRENKEFAVFKEAPIEFPPTYKFDEGSDVYDTSPKQRIPSYTDRVLISGENARIVKYTNIQDLLSDHRPVVALVEVPIE